MNNEIGEFIHCLESEKLNTRDFNARSERQSGVYVVRASFIDGRKFAVHVTDVASATQEQFDLGGRGFSFSSL